MRIKAVHLVYFSPTQTTKQILESIAGSLPCDIVEHIDVTSPKAGRYDFAGMKKDELLLIGAPVYAGRIPETAVRRFRGLKSKGSPAVVIVLYGNREYEDALLELADLSVSAGFVPVAGGAFIGEHSFSSESLPLAKGRPDKTDLQHAVSFGASIAEYLKSVRSVRSIPSLNLPGNRPFREHPKLPLASPVTDAVRCIACRTCLSACPTNSISIRATAESEPEACILCCACVKICPQQARSLNDPHIVMIMEWLSSHTAKRKEPEVFMCGA